MKTIHYNPSLMQMLAMIPVGFLHNPKAFTPPDYMFHFYSFSPQFPVLPLLLFSQRDLFWFLMRQFTFGMYFSDTLVAQVGFEFNFRINLQFCLGKHFQIRFSSLCFQPAMKYPIILLIYNELRFSYVPFFWPL